MRRRPLIFSAIMFTAGAMGAAFAHLLELPAKRRCQKSEYVRLQRTLYWNFGRVAGPFEALALLSTAGLAFWLHKTHSRNFPLVLIATACLTAAHGAFWILVAPANREMLSWPLESIPDDWSRWRDRWEYTHAARAFLLTGALASVILAVLPEDREQAAAYRR